MFRSVSKYWKEKKRAVRFLYIVLTLFSILALVRSLARGEYFNVLVCFLTLLLFMIPRFVEHNLRLHLPDLFEGLALVFIFATEILGEVNCYYQKIPHWDTMLHVTSGFLFGAFGFALLDILNRSARSRGKLSPLCLAVVAFCFSMTVGVLWEFYEFGCDAILHTDMQKDTYVGEIYTVLLDEQKTNTVVPVRNMQTVALYCLDGEGKPCEVILDGYIDIGLVDTMKDLAANLVGAIVFSVIGYFHVKHTAGGGVTSRLIPAPKE